jgi:ribokinase
VGGGSTVPRVISAPRLTVLGSLNMDVSVTVPRLPAPGATVLGGAAAFAPGGKGANQAVAAARLGAFVRMVGCVGDDDFGARLLAALGAEGVDASGVRAVPGAPTGLAMITVDEAGENIITVAPGANREVGTPEIAALGAAPADVLVVSAEIPVAAIKAALAAVGWAGPAGPPVRVLNLAPAPPEAAELLAVGVDWVVVNESEAAAVLGTPVAGLAGASRAAADLAARGPRHVVVTAGAAGAAYCGPGAGAATGSAGAAARPAGAATGSAGAATRSAGAAAKPAGAAAKLAGAATEPGEVSVAGGVVTVPGFRVRAVHTVGAGDTFVGALAVALSAGIAPFDAAVAAAAAAATATTRPGTQSGMPRPADVLAATGHPWPVQAS